MRVELSSPSEAHTIGIGDALGRVLRAADVVCLHGELGAGKTCMVRGIARGAGAEWERVSSPTFVVVHEYPARGDVATGAPVFHVDAYRLRGGVDELDTLGWERVMGGEGVVVVEWPERVEGPGGLPRRGESDRRTDVEIEHAGESARRIGIEMPDAWAARAGMTELRRLAGALTCPERQVSGTGGSLPAGWARCPVSGRAVPPDAETFPFADQKCRMADLNRWLSGAYRLSRDVEPGDLEDPDTGAEAPG